MLQRTSASPFLAVAAAFMLIAALSDSRAQRAAQPPSQPDPAPNRVRNAINRVEAPRIGAYVDRLVAFPTRHTLSPQNVEAAHWIRDQFRELGYEDISLHDVALPGKTRHNIVCTKPGAAPSEPILLIGAHFDSRMSDLGDAGANAPGADDNASGVAALLEAARVLRDIPTRWTIQFVAFTGEEQGLSGSSAYAREARETKRPIGLMINLDMVGHVKDPDHPTIIVERDMGNAHRENDAASQTFADRMAAAAQLTKLQTKLGPIYGSDYMPFERIGVPCIGLFDGADDAPFYHTGEDKRDLVDPAYCADAARIVIATVLEIAGTP